MDACNDDQPLLSDSTSQVFDDFVTRFRIQPASRLIEKQDLWGGDKLTSNRKPSFLSARYALADGCADNGVSLILQSERKEELVYASPSLVARDCALACQTTSYLLISYKQLPGQRQLCSKVQRFSHRQRSDQSVFLLNVGAYALEILIRNIRAVDIYIAHDIQFGTGISMSKYV